MKAEPPKKAWDELYTVDGEGWDVMAWEEGKGKERDGPPDLFRIR